MFKLFFWWLRLLCLSNLATRTAASFASALQPYVLYREFGMKKLFVVYACLCQTWCVPGESRLKRIVRVRRCNKNMIPDDTCHIHVIFKTKWPWTSKRLSCPRGHKWQANDSCLFTVGVETCCVLAHPECSCRKKNQQQQVRARGLGLVSIDELCISFFDFKLSVSAI